MLNSENSTVVYSNDGSVPIHNLSEERSVGLVNYGMQIRGKNNLSTVSRNIVLNKSFDVLCDDVLAHTKNAGNLCLISRLSQLNGIKK